MRQPKHTITFASVCWGGNVNKTEKSKLDKIIKKASGVVGKQQDSFKNMYEKRVYKKANQILSDESHPLRKNFKVMPSGRIEAPEQSTTRCGNSFVPSAVRVVNNGSRPTLSKNVRRRAV